MIFTLQFWRAALEIAAGATLLSVLGSITSSGLTGPACCANWGMGRYPMGTGPLVVLV